MNLNDLYSQVIQDHNLSKHNRHELENPTVVTPGRNPSCGDEIELQLIVEEGRIADAAYTGVGCAISQASVSIMIDLVRGKIPAAARKLCEIFLKMIRREQLSKEDEQKLEEAAALMNVSNMPARVKCAAMPWHTLLSALDTLE